MCNIKERETENSTSVSKMCFCPILHKVRTGWEHLTDCFGPHRFSVPIFSCMRAVEKVLRGLSLSPRVRDSPSLGAARSSSVSPRGARWCLSKPEKPPAACSSKKLSVDPKTGRDFKEQEASQSRGRAWGLFSGEQAGRGAA